MPSAENSDADAPPHNPLKLPFFVFDALVGLAMIVLGAVAAAWGTVALGILLAAGSGVAIATIRRGRNPWWLRTPLDGWFARRRAD